jgi:HAE1 family hydrophobic/amphiphilic exporter-1
MHPIESFVRNPVKVTVGVLLVALFGSVALFRMPMQLTPEVQMPTLTIETRWPGATPQDVEREIVQEQEEQLKSVEGVTKMTSESTDSVGRITMEFLVGTNMQEALLKVNSRLQQVPEYPVDADEPVISTSNSSDRPIAWFILSAKQPTEQQIVAFQQQHPELAASLEPVRTARNPGLALLRLRLLAKEHPQVNDLLPPDVDVTKLRKFCEDVIEARFERVPGVSNSNVLGGLEEEMQVVVDPQKLAARSLTIVDVRNALRDQNKDTSGGDFWEGKRRYVVRTLGQFRSPEQVAEQLLAVRDGAPVYVRDVAEVRLGYKKPDGLVRRFGTSSIALNALRETGANVLDVMDGLRDANRELNERVLRQRGLELTQVYDETEYIYSAIGLVNQNIVVGGLLTVMVLLLFLRSGRSTLVIGLAIPTSIIGTFLMLNLMGRSLNVISLAGLSFAVGMLVDNAVVVLENIYSHYQRGDAPFTAAVKGTKEVWGAVIASTLTTLAVFVPVVFVEQEAGQLFRDIALAISSAVGLSLIVSMTLIPTAAARLLRKQGDHDEQLAPGGNGQSRHSQPPAREPRGAVATMLAPVDMLARGFVGSVVGLNDWIQRGVLRRCMVVAMLVGTSALVTYLLWPKVEYLPTGNRNLVFGIVLPPPGYNLDQLMLLGETVEEEMRPYWDVDPDSPEARKLKYPVIGDFFYVARGRQVFLGVRTEDPTRAAELIPMIMEIRGKLPGTFVVAKQSSLFEQGLTGGRTVDIEITGPELEKLVMLGGRVLGQVMNPEAPVVPNAQAIPKPSLDLSSPEVHLTPRLIQSAEMGVNATDLGYAVNALVDGAYATDYIVGGDKIDLVIIGEEKSVTRTQDLNDLPVATPSGQLVPLSALATVELSSGPEQVNHRERQRAITIEVTPPPEMPLEEAIQRIRSQIVEPLEREGALDGGYLITLSGTADKLRDTWQALWANLLLALLITYLLMAALFESWTYPFVIIMSVPLGAVGGILGLRLLTVYQTGLAMLLSRPIPPPQSLDVLTMLGFVILIGTVVNNAILIVHQSLNHMRDEGYAPRPAILESVRTRIRPIFMTTLTTVFGLAPLVFFPGAGSELYRGLGSVVLGGLLVSTIFTLVLVPTMFSLMMDFTALLGWKVGAPRLDEQQPEPRHALPPRAALELEPPDATAPHGDGEFEPQPTRTRLPK